LNICEQGQSLAGFRLNPQILNPAKLARKVPVMSLNNKQFTLKGNLIGATTLSITTFSIMTLTMKGLFVTASINVTQHNKTIFMASAIMLSVAFYLLLC
jgi:hypothetical protein